MIFMLLGFQLCLFIHHTGVLRIEALRDNPDTVVIVKTVIDDKPVMTDAKISSHSEDLIFDNVKRVNQDTIRRNSEHSKIVNKVRAQRRKIENFYFNPNTATLEEFQRLGFTEKQAQSIVNYRVKGGRFSRASDFARSYVVSDSVFKRLEPFIRIPKVDINTADSSAFDALPGIGPYYASKMVEYRSQLGGYSCIEQLMELYHFDEEKFGKIADLIECRDPYYFDLWNADEKTLASHPVIRNRSTAHSIWLYIENSKLEELTVDGLFKSGIIDSLQRVKLNRCVKKAASLGALNLVSL